MKRRRDSRTTGGGEAAGSRLLGVLGWTLAAAFPVVVFLFYRNHVPRFVGPASQPPFDQASSGLPPSDYAFSLWGLILLLLASLGAGYPLAEALIPGKKGLERALLAHGLGLAVVGMAGFALGEASMLHRSSIGILVGLCAVSGIVWAVWNRRRGRGSPTADHQTGSPRNIDRQERFLRWGVLSLGIALMAVTLIFTLAPLTANDALVYHLNLPHRYLEAHSSAPLTWNVYSRMPHNMETLYTVALALGNEITPRLLHWWTRLLLLAVTYVLTRRVVSARGASIAMAILVAAPLISDPRTVANIDMGVAFFFGLALLLWMSQEKRRRDYSALAAGILLGYMAGMKYTALLVLVIVAVLWVVSLRNQGTKRLLRDGLQLALGSFLLFLPWMIRGELRQGNPFYPLLWSQLGGIEWSARLGRELLMWQRNMGMGRTLSDYLLLPWNVSLHGQPGPGYRFFDGVVGPFFLALVPVWIATSHRRIPRERWLVAALLLGFAAWAWGPQQIRFAMPLLIPAACIGAAALSPERGEASGKRNGVRFLAHVAPHVLLVAGLLHIAALASYTVYDVLPVVSGRESRGSYLTRHFPPYELYQQANRQLPPEARVLFIWENRTYYLEREYLADSFFEASQLAELVRESGTPEELARRLHSRGVTDVIYNEPLGRFFMQAYPPELAETLAGFGKRYLEPIATGGGLTLFRFHSEPTS